MHSKYAEAPLHGRFVMADDLLLQIEIKGRTANMNLHLWVKVHLWVWKLISIELYHHSVLCIKLLHTTKTWAPHLQKLQTSPNNLLNRELWVSWLGRKDTRVWNRSQGILHSIGSARQYRWRSQKDITTRLWLHGICFCWVLTGAKALFLCMKTWMHHASLKAGSRCDWYPVKFTTDYV